MKIIILFFMAGISLSLHAQPDMKNFDPPLLTRSIGVSFHSFDGLNSRIANRDEFEQLKDHSGTLSLGCMHIYKRFVSNIDFIAGSSMSGDRHKKSSTVGYLGAGIDLGYDVIAADKIILAPLVGIGGQGYIARFFRDDSEVPFDLVLTSPDVQTAIKPVDFKNSFFVYRLGFALAAKHPKDRSRTFGIQARYVGSFNNSAWKSGENQDLADAPKDRLGQFQISLVASGMPQFMKKK
jgi:hypothetical protein